VLQKEIESGKNEVSDLEGKIAAKEMHLGEVAISCQLNNEQRQQLEELVKRKDSEISRLQKELDQTRRSLDTLVVTRKAEGTA